MTLVVTPQHAGEVALPSEHDGAVTVLEPPTYRLVHINSVYDSTHATLWFYSSRALKIQTNWRRFIARRAFARRKAEVFGVRAARVLAYYDTRMRRLLHFIAWEGTLCSNAATTIQRWFRRRLSNTR